MALGEVGRQPQALQWGHTAATAEFKLYTLTAHALDLDVVTDTQSDTA